jgi:polysaccharide deacetylase family sporulation protein PdaB
MGKLVWRGRNRTSVGGHILRKRLFFGGCFAVTFLLFCSSLSVSEAGVPSPKGRVHYESTGDVIREVPGDEKILALTFDDGPDPKETPAILDILKKYDAKATFFVIGNKVRRNPQIVRREWEEGHEIANHTYHHQFLGRVPDWQIQQEIGETQTAIMETTGKKARLFRPPGGVFNSRVLDACKKEQLQLVLWSWHQDTQDWAKPGAGRIVRKVLRNTRNGDIVLMHDYVSGRSQTVDALEIILPELIRRGYHFVTVSELIGHAKAVW